MSGTEASARKLTMDDIRAAAERPYFLWQSYVEWVRLPETALRLKLSVMHVVMNNSSLAFECHVQRYVHEEMCPEASEFLDLPFVDVAPAFGAQGERVMCTDQFLPALRRAEDSGKPAIVDVVVSHELPPPVTRHEAAGLRKI